MTPIVILSSPSKTFARSPTPADTSSPLPSPSTLFGSQATRQTPKKFKTANVQRDGFSGFSRARSLLGTKTGAENIPIRSPETEKEGLKVLSPKRFKSTAMAAHSKDAGITKIAMDKEDPIRDEDTSYEKTTTIKPTTPSSALKRINGAPMRAVSRKANAPNSQMKSGTTGNEERVSRPQDDPFELQSWSPSVSDKPAIQERTKGVPRVRQPLSPLNIDMGTSRRIDWTPTKDAAEAGEDASPSIGLSTSFSGGLLGSFGYHGDTAVITPANCHEIDTAPTKRRRIEMIETGMSNNMPPPRSTAIKKGKVAPKKALTITGLATSNYIGKDAAERDHTTLDQSLSTQARALQADQDDITSEIAKVKAAKKQRLSKKNPKKSNLVSPTSAIKALENQDALFGSASQLARDESPSLMRDTLEAIRQSGSYHFSSPLRTQDTESISIESTTPRAVSGVSRFTKKRGLWAAAGRDEDNALLHVDDPIDIDNFETPDLRHAFTGKDALVQPSASRARHSKSPEKQSPSLRGGCLPQSSPEDVWDIGNMETLMAPIRTFNLPAVQVRALHTTERVKSPRKRASSAPVPEILSIDEPELTKEKGYQSKNSSKEPPKKPAFAGLTTEKLQKQIAAYGFKPLKKRDQMIEVLEKCWDAKHIAPEQARAVQAEPVIEDVDDSLKHSDHLSNVHGLANRPIPKEKKVPEPRKPQKAKDPKEPKPRKKREPKAAKERDPDAPKVVRKRKPKAKLSEEKVVDINYIENLEDPAHASKLTEAAVAALADGAIEKATAKKLVAKPKPKTPTEVASKAAAKQISTPPLTLSLSCDTPVPLAKEVIVSSPHSAADIDSQISLAITSYVAPASQNHQRDPTWHEKILMYDPIVLEDLTVWLNTEGLDKIGEDREVSALEVRDWCEQRGICCLWRGGWRGDKAAKE
jgi:Slx4 endonuclease